jgi:hypothetical protein
MSGASAVAADFGNTTVNSSAGDAVDLSGNTGNVTFAALNLTPDANLRGLDAANVAGTITSTSGAITTTGAAALNISGPAGRTPLALTLNDISATNSATPGVDLNLTSGNLSVPTAGAGIDTNVANATGIGIQVRNSGTGTISFGDTAVSGSGGTGVVLGTASNGNSSVFNFADLDINPDSGQRAFHAVQNTGQITTTNGTFTTAGGAVNVEIVGTSAASRTPLSMTLEQVAVGGTPTSGIILTSTSAPAGAAGFRINGTGTTDGSGGSVASASGDAIALTDVERFVLKNYNIGDSTAANNETPNNQVSITDDGIQITRVTPGAGGTYGLSVDNVKIADTGNHGINGSNGATLSSNTGIEGGNVGLEFINSEIINAGNDLALMNESAMHFGSGFPDKDMITGTVTITNATFSGFTGWGFSVENAGNGTLNMAVTGSVFQNNDQIAIEGNSGIHVNLDGSTTANNPKANLTVTNTNFINLDLDGIFFVVDPGGTGQMTVNGGTFTMPEGDNVIQFSSGSRDTDDVEVATALIQNINVTACRGNIIQLSAGAGTYNATIQGGTIDSGNTTNSGGSHIGRAIDFNFDADHDPGGAGTTGDSMTVRVKVDGVTFNNIGVDGMRINTNEVLPGSTLDAIITNNTIGTAAEPVGRSDTGEGFEAIFQNMTARVSVQGNSIFTRGITTTSEGIDIDAETGSTVNATVVSNTINSGPNANNFDANTEVAGTTMCLDLRTNTSATGPDPDYALVAAAGSTYNFERAGAGAVTALEVQGQQTSGTASVTGTINKNGGANCAEPTTPPLPSGPVTSEASKADEQIDNAQSGGIVVNAAPVSGRTATGEKQAESLMGGGVTSRPFVSLPAAQPAGPASVKRNGGNRMRHTAEDSALRIEGVDEARTLAQQKKTKWGTPRTHDVPSANPPVINGNNITWNIGTLPAGKTVTITFDVVIENPFNGNPAQVSNQATVTADGGISVLSDDPSEGGANDPTITPVAAQPEIFVRDAEGSEPGELVFTVTLSNPPTTLVSVDFTTADGTATVADGDYTPTSGTVTFQIGQRVQTISVPILSNSPNNESPETITVTLSNPVGGIITDGTATGTITEDAAPGETMISELRTSGPGGPGDDFVEVYNNRDTPLTVTTTDGSPGWGLFIMGADCNATPILVGVIPNTTTTPIPARGHFLFTGSQYSLMNYGGTNAALGDATLVSDIPNDANLALFNTTNLANLSTLTRLDAVGFGTNVGNNCNLLREGSNLGAAAGSALQHSYFRKLCDFQPGQGCLTQGTPKDTGDNASDFTFGDTDGTLIVGTGQRLAAPGPENISSPRKTDLVASLLLDSSAGGPAPPNRVRDLTPGDPMFSANGTMSIRRRLVNNTGAPVTRLRFRISEMTTLPVGPGQADLRALSSLAVSGVMITNDSGTCGGPASCTVTVEGTTLEQPPSQPVGGGLNATFSVTLGTPLAAGASVNVQFLLGVQNPGSFRFLIVSEVLP